MHFNKCKLAKLNQETVATTLDSFNNLRAPSLFPPIVESRSS